MDHGWRDGQYGVLAHSLFTSLFLSSRIRMLGIPCIIRCPLERDGERSGLDCSSPIP